MLCLCRGGWRGKCCSHLEDLQGFVARASLFSCMPWFGSTLGERGTWMPWGRSQTSAPHPLAWQTQRQEPSRCEQPHSQPGTLDYTVQALLSHPPAPQPAPFPKLRQPFLHVTFHSLQVTVLSSKAQEYLSSFGGCSSLDVLMCTSCNMSTCPLL